MKGNLDSHIKDWGDRTRPPKSDPGLKNAIMDQIRSDEPISEDEPREIEIKKFPVPLGWAAALVLGGLLIGVLVARRPDPVQPVPPDNFGLSQSDLDEVRIVAKEISHLFPEGVQWISKINGKITFEPRDPQRVSVEEDKQILISYAVLSQVEPGKWQQLSRHDIITYANEPVNITAGEDVQLWCHLTDDGHAMVDVKLNLKIGEERLALDREELQKVGDQTVLTDKGSKYRVVQTVHLL